MAETQIESYSKWVIRERQTLDEYQEDSTQTVAIEMWVQVKNLALPV